MLTPSPILARTGLQKLHGVGSRRLFFYPSPLPQTFSPKRLGYVSVLGGIRKHIATFSEIPDVMPTLDNM